MKNYGAMDLFKRFYGLVINDINIKHTLYGIDFKRVQPKIKTYLHDFEKINRLSAIFNC